jgi:hypothetical protein
MKAALIAKDWRSSISSRHDLRRSCSCAEARDSNADAPGSASSAAASIGSLRREGARDRARSMARLRAMATSQVIGLARASSKAAALSHTVR